MTKRTAKETADNEGVDRRNERIYREMYRKEMKAKRSEERRDNEGEERERGRGRWQRGTLRKPICPFISGRLN